MAAHVFATLAFTFALLTGSFLIHDALAGGGSPRGEHGVYARVLCLALTFGFALAAVIALAVRA